MATEVTKKDKERLAKAWEKRQAATPRIKRVFEEAESLMEEHYSLEEKACKIYAEAEAMQYKAEDLKFKAYKKFRLVDNMREQSDSKYIAAAKAIYGAAAKVTNWNTGKVIVDYKETK